MTTASWNGTVVAESDDIVTVEGNAYFPREAVREEFLRPSETHTVCPWKGTRRTTAWRSTGGRTATRPGNPTPKDAAAQIAGRVAFWHGVEVG